MPMTMPKIMLVEDDHTMVALLQTLLRIEGFNICQLDHVDNLDSIIESIRREQPDLILLDVHLKRLDGFDLLSGIRQDTELHSLRVLMSSGTDFNDRCAQEGADGFILKPYMPEDLIGKIRRTLG